MLELRILRGLHRGATLALGATSNGGAEDIAVGSDTSCDVVLLDDGVAPRHLLVRISADGWLFLAQDAEVQMHVTPRQENSTGDHSNVTHLSGTDVTLGLFEHDDPWLPEAHWISEKFLATTSAREFADHERVPDADSVADVQHANLKSRTRASRAIKFAAAVWVFAACVAIVGFLASKPAGLTSARGSSKSGVDSPSHSSTAAMQAASPAPFKPASPLTAEDVETRSKEIHETTARMIRKHDLASLVSYELLDGSLTFSGELSASERLRFESFIISLNNVWHGDVPIKAQISAVSSAAPFKIAQVLYARIPSLLLDDGQRVFVGQSVQGYRLVSVEAGKVVFEGKRRLEIKP